MVKVEAVVLRERVETVIDAVEEQTGHVGVTVVEAVGHGRQRGITHEYRGRELVGHDEREQRLRQEARLEDAPSVLVRDPALAPVTYRLDDRHAHVPGLLLDGVDHDLDAFPQDDCLDLGHVTTSLRRSTSRTSRQTRSR